jgi:hypothetical protein
MREGWTNRGTDYWLPLEKQSEMGRDEKVTIVLPFQLRLFFLEIYERDL